MKEKKRKRDSNMFRGKNLATLLTVPEDWTIIFQNSLLFRKERK